MIEKAIQALSQGLSKSLKTPQDLTQFYAVLKSQHRSRVRCRTQ